jgi:hypothetical protein
MAHKVTLKTNCDARGSLTVAQDEIPFRIRRVFFLHDLTGQERGGHGHKRTRQALVCIGGTCAVTVVNTSEQVTFLLQDSSECLVLEPEDWHTIHAFDGQPIIAVFASRHYDPDDYFYDRPDTNREPLRRPNYRNLVVQFLRFNIVGIINTALTYIIFSTLVLIGIPFYLALAADYTFGIVFSFFANKKFTFRIDSVVSGGCQQRSHPYHAAF